MLSVLLPDIFIQPTLVVLISERNLHAHTLHPRTPNRTKQKLGTGSIVSMVLSVFQSYCSLSAADVLIVMSLFAVHKHVLTSLSTYAGVVLAAI